MKRWSTISLTVLMMVTLILSGCGSKSEKEVVEDLGQKIEKLNSYRTDAVMMFEHSGKKQTYRVNVVFKKPYYYRVSLTDGKKKNKQMILRNSGGVFVLTPELNKSYRFESTWPNNRSQAYLYHSLNQDIQNDPNPGFKAKDNQYIFDTKTSYNTTQLANQSITLKKDLTPKQVQVRDKDRNVIVTVKFEHFEVNPTVDAKTFDVKKNMTAAGTRASKTVTTESTTFAVHYPTAKIAGTRLTKMKPEVSRDGEKYVLKYSGKKPFTLIESKSSVSLADDPVFASGDPANLGFAVGAAGSRTLQWSAGGTDYLLASEKLSREELTVIAQSVGGTVTK